MSAPEDSDHKKFERLYTLYQQPLYRYLYRSVLEESTAMDLLQDTFLNFMNVFLSRDIPDDDQCRMYLFRAARNVMINHQKSFYSRNVSGSGGMETDWITDDRKDFQPEHKYTTAEEASEARKELDHLISSLHEKERTALILRYNESLSFEELAEVLELTVSSAFRLVKKAESHIKHEAEKRGFHPERLLHGT